MTAKEDNDDIEKESIKNGDPIFSNLRKVFHWIGAILILLFSSFVFYIIAFRAFRSEIWPIAIKHFAAIVGLPMASIAALFIVIVLEYVSGKIEFQILGLKFKGAAGQILFWILCFLSIVLSIKLLWDLT